MSTQEKTDPFCLGVTRRRLLAGGGIALGSLAIAAATLAAAEEEISRAAAAIHQEPVFQASRKRVYEALTDAKQFDKVIQLGAAVKSGTVKAPNPPQISREPGGAFALFGGYVTGRNIELLPNERIVQAWRAGSWPAGHYSIARFQLLEDGAGTKIIFDHTGFPKENAEHLAEGWHVNYWEPLAKFLA